jgi:hypothetical protein
MRLRQVCWQALSLLAAPVLLMCAECARSARVANARVHLQQQDLAHETVHHLSRCLAANSVAVQLSACQVVRKLATSPHTRHALHVREIARKLVELNEKQSPLSTAPAIECIGLLCDLSSENADAVVRANGLHAMLCTLEDDCPAQVRCSALSSALSRHSVRCSAHRPCSCALQHPPQHPPATVCGAPRVSDVHTAGPEACAGVHVQGAPARTCALPEPRAAERSHDCADGFGAAPHCAQRRQRPAPVARVVLPCAARRRACGP